MFCTVSKKSSKIQTFSWTEDQNHVFKIKPVKHDFLVYGMHQW